MSAVPGIYLPDGRAMDALPEARMHQDVACPVCGQAHALYGVMCEEMHPSDLILVFDCPEDGRTYVGGVNGRLIIALNEQ